MGRFKIDLFFSSRFVLILVAIGSSAYFLHRYSLNIQEREAIVGNPLIHDVFIIDSEKLADYVPAREKLIVSQVTKVEGNNIHFKVSAFKYLRTRDAIKGIRSDKLLTRNYFSQKPMVLTKNELNSLWYNEDIKDAGRPSGPLLFGGTVIARQRIPTKQVKYPLGHRDNQQAIAYYQGNMGFEQNWQEAFRLFKKAAEKGHNYAQLNLANMFMDGHGVEQSEEKALYWLKVAKETNFAPAIAPYEQLCQKHKMCD